MSRKITFDSVKLPVNYDEFHKKALVGCLAEFGVMVKVGLRQPIHIIPINGYFEKCSTIKPALRRNDTRYSMGRTLSRGKITGNLNLVKIKESLLKTIEANSLSTPAIFVTSAKFFIHNKTYQFRYHAPAKAIMLKTIDGKPIGRLKETQIEALLCKDGDLHFCAPSHCTKQYIEKWICEN